jgi:GT2 family glycosyltransferase/glycosyltransferase involved in cell wall biosynthesis
MPDRSRVRLPDWIVVGQELWDSVERRNQLLFRALAARNPQARVLFSELPLRPRQLGHWRPTRPRRVAENIWTIRPVRPLPDSVSRRLSDRAEAAQIASAARRLGLHEPWLWTQDPRVSGLVDPLPVADVVYDLTDDWAAFEDNAAARARVQARIEALGRRARLVVACSQSLADGARAWSETVLFLPNAVDPLSPPAPEPDRIAGLGRPRVGYVGTLHPARIDIPLLSEAARLRPDWLYLLVGPKQLSEADEAQLLGMPNVRYLGTRPHHEVRAYIEHFDVCLLPNRVTEFTRSLDPLKLYEYLAGGRPIVSTGVPHPSSLAPFIDVVADAKELVAAAERLMQTDDDVIAQKRRAIVAGHTWEARAAELEGALRIEPAGPPTEEVSVVIVSYNTRGMLHRCLEALIAQALPMQVLVVDNASTDGSVDMVREEFPAVELKVLDDNAGFARANNVAFDECRGRYVLLLNSDAFLEEGALRELLATAKRHPDAGAIGARLLNPDGTLQRSAWPFPRTARLLLEAFGVHRILRRTALLEDLGTWSHDEEREVDFLIGACLLLRSDALREVDGFDEEFWLYGEEADMQRRMADRGWRVILAPNAVATHVGGASSVESATRLRHFYLGQKRFLRKHGGRGAWPLAWIALVLGSLLRGRRAALHAAVDLARK